MLQLTSPLFLHFTIYTVKYTRQNLVKKAKPEDLELLILDEKSLETALTDGGKEIILYNRWYDVYSITPVDGKYQVLVKADAWETKLQSVKNSHPKKSLHYFVTKRNNFSVYNINQKTSPDYFPKRIVMSGCCFLKRIDNPPGKVPTPPPQILG